MNRELNFKVQSGIANAKRIYDQPSISHISISSIASPEVIYLLDKIEQMKLTLIDVYAKVAELQFKLDLIENKKSSKQKNKSDNKITETIDPFNILDPGNYGKTVTFDKPKKLELNDDSHTNAMKLID